MTAWLLIWTASLGAASCPLPDPHAGLALDYSDMRAFTLSEGDDLYSRFAPIILVEEYGNSYNRIGTPAARLDNEGEEVVYVDPSEPTFYVQQVEWPGDHGKYQNLIYRTHFERSIGNENSTDGGKGLNVGLLTIITLDENQRPVWVNTVGTCGCFHAILPTNFLAAECYPDGWDRETFKVFGEKLPGQVTFPEDFDENIRPVVYLRTGSHRVAEVNVASVQSVSQRYQIIAAKQAPMEALRHLPLGSRETSFYYEDGDLKGLVKGAYKKRESLLLGGMVGDGRVGQDRIYGPPEELPRGFYTTINPLKKSGSDMWDYKSFLKQNGWNP